MQKGNIKIGSNKNFGVVFFIFFLLVAIYPLLSDENIRIWSLILSIIFLTLGFLNSKLLSPLNIAWYKFGIFLGNFISPIVMGLVFFVIVTPTSILMRTFGKNLLNLKKNNKKSYWIEKSKIKSKMKDQF
ncbi:SxtJ family membrane protein [Candidatus Pelagibacter sp.]|nr:SxtJ family membrane protein [Candidatus Pelagibacter sp.]